MSFTEFLLMFRDIFCFIPFTPVLNLGGDTARFTVAKLAEKTVNLPVSNVETDLFEFEPFLDGTLYIGFKKNTDYATSATIKLYADNSTTPTTLYSSGFSSDYNYVGFQCSFGHKYKLTGALIPGSGANNVSFVVAGTIGLKDNAKFVLHEIAE